MTLHRLTAEVDLSWAMFPAALRRIHRFATVHGSETPPDRLVSLVTAHFVGRTGMLGLWVGADGDALAAHCLALIEEQAERGRWAFVVQLEADQPPLPAHVRRDGRAQIDAWARAMGATHIDMWTTLPERLWRRYGFELHRKIMRRSLETTNA